MYQKFKRAFCFFIFLASLSSNAQDKILDSLKYRIASAETSLQKATLHNDIAVVFYNNRIYYDSCYYYTEKAYQISKKNNLEEQRARALFNFGMIYSDLGDYNMAIDYFSNAKEVFEPLGDKLNLSVINSSIGALYFNKKDYKSAKLYFNQAIAISQGINDSIAILIDNVNIAESEYYLKDYEASKERLEHAKELSASLGVDFSSLHIYYGNALFQLGYIDRAEEEAEIGLQMAQKDADIKNISEASELLYKITLGKGLPEQALSHYKEYALGKNNLNEAKQLNTVENLKLNFELKRKQKELDYLTEKNKYQSIIYILGGLGVLLLTVLVFRQMKIIRMTQDMYDIQERLVGHELKERERSVEKSDVSSFQATTSKEL